MRHAFGIMCLLLLVVTPASSFAGNIYVAIKGGVSVVQSGTLDASHGGDSVSLGTKDQGGATMAQGVAFGMDLYTRGKKLPVRAELEYLHRNNVSVAWSDTIAGKDNRLSGHASVDTVMLNVFCDLVSPSESPIIPFIMLSVGAALTDISTSWTEDGDILGSGRDHSTSLAGGIGGGLCFNINKYTNFDVSYRFVSLEPVTIRQSGLPGDIDMAMHDILLGLRFTF